MGFRNVPLALNVPACSHAASRQRLSEVNARYWVKAPPLQPITGQEMTARGGRTCGVEESDVASGLRNVNPAEPCLRSCLT